LRHLGPPGYRRRVVPNRRRSGPLIVIIAACVLAVSSNACSFAFVEGPPPQEGRRKTFDCTDSYSWPVVDTVLAVVGGTVCMFILGLGKALGGSPKPAFYGLVALTVVAPAGGAVYGYDKVGDCRDARRSAPPGYAPRPAD
jgi:hypothetical protein